MERGYGGGHRLGPANERRQAAKQSYFHEHSIDLRELS
jgi:hypothetical protein